MKRIGHGLKFWRPLCLSILILPATMVSQDWFDQRQLMDQPFHSRIPLAITDMNQDLRDDIIVLDGGRDVHILYQVFSGEKLRQEEIISLDSVGYWSVVAFDIDNDGDRDLCFGSEKDQLKVIYQDSNGWRLEKIPSFDIWSQAMNAVDINEDGWTDLFVCNDIGHNVIYLNEQGSLIRSDEFFQDIDSLVAPGNYGSVWTDYDDDGDLDLYLAKCKAFAGPGDPRRKNILYENQDGLFVDRSDVLDLAMDDQSWTGDFVDINNDGDLECVITNHGAPCRVLDRVGQVFEDVSNEVGIDFNSTVIQNINHDFNYDGWIDIMFTGQQEIIYANRGDGTFDFAPSFFQPYYRGNSAAVGDLNWDGKIDLYMTYGNLIGEASTIEDEVWINQTDQGHFLDFYLHGTQTNPDAIGTKVRIFGPWGQQVREIKCGQSYGIQQSLTVRFGLGDVSLVDSAIIQWPNGVEEFLRNVPANSYIYSLQEAWTFTSTSSLPYRVDICDGDSITLSYPPSTRLNWNTGDSGDEIVVRQQGFYQASFEYVGQTYFLPGTEVHVDAIQENPLVTTSDCICEGESITLYNENLDRVLWSNGQRDISIEVDRAGWYYFEYNGNCQASRLSDSIYLDVIGANAPITKGQDSIAKNQKLTLRATGDSILWFADSLSQTPIATSDSFCIQGIEKDTTFWLTNVIRKPGESLILGPKLNDLDTSLNQVNRILYFGVDEDIVLHGFKVYAEVEGPRVFVIQDSRRRDIFRDTLTILQGENDVKIEKEIPSNFGLYQLSTDQDYNMEQYGTPTPRLLIKTSHVDYPYEFGEFMTVYHSSFSTNRWDYFFELHVSSSSNYCSSERIPYQLFYKQTTSTEEEVLDVVIYPTLVHDRVFANVAHRLAEVYNLDGHKVRESEDLAQIRWNELPTGYYLIRISDLNGNPHIFRVVKVGR